jgi:hypothetical protein
LSMFPRDAITYFAELSTNNSSIFSAGTMRTYLHAEVRCPVTSDIQLQWGTAGTNYLIDTESTSATDDTTNIQYATTSSLRFQTSVALANPCYVQIVYVPRDRTVTPDPVEQYATSTQTAVNVTNFPTGFNVNNWQFATSTTVLNPLASSTLDGLRVLCTNCSTGTSTGTGSSTVIINGGYNGMNFQEMLFTSCVIIAILSISLWRFIFRKAKEI